MEENSSHTVTNQINGRNKMKLDKLEYVIDIPEGIQASYANTELTMKGPKGENTRKLVHPIIKLEIKEGSIVLSASPATKKEKTLMGTFRAHVNNMIKGVESGFEYKLKICAGHFPMNVSINGDQFVVKNFLGEKVPRKLKIIQGATVKLDGDVITVEALDKEVAGQTAASIEKLTVVKNRDRRIFQDGIFITQKADKQVS